MGKELTGPTWDWRARASRKGSVFSLPRTHQALTPRYALRGKRLGPEKGWISSQRGPSHRFPGGTGLTVRRPSTVPFSHFSKWEAHVRAPRPPGSHTSTVRWAYTHRHTQSGQQPQQRGDQGLATTRERRHYRSCEDPLKPLVGLLCGGQLDVGGSSCLKVKPLLVPAWGTGGTAHQASSSGSHWDPRGLVE